MDAAIHRALSEPLNRILEYTAILSGNAAREGDEQFRTNLDKIRKATRSIIEFIDSLPDPGLPIIQGTGASEATRASVAHRLEHGRDHAVPAAFSDNALEPVLGPGRILVVDDQEDNRDLLCRRLVRQGHRTTVAENGRVALEWLQREPFDLVMLDVMMPELDGYEVLARMKADPELRHIPVIMVSAQTELSSAIKCIEMGAEDYLQKPFNSTLLAARVDASLEKKRLRECEQRHREQALRAEATLERHRSLAQMVAGVAHEINTPLGIASTAVSIIANRMRQPDLRDLCESNAQAHAQWTDIVDAAALLEKNVLRAHKLVETFKKISVNQVTDEQERVDLLSVLDDAVELYRINATQARLKVSIDTSGLNGEPMWTGFPGYLTQVLMNFLQNIERYAYPEGEGGPVDIVLSDQRSEGEAWFTLLVRDYGRGIGPENLPRVFEPFFTTGRGRGGTGLGLAIVHNIVTAVFKGAVGVSSEPGKGTSFRLIFPQVVPSERNSLSAP